MKIGFNEGCNRFCENHSVLEDLALCEKYGFDYIDVQSECLDRELAAGKYTLEQLGDYFRSHNIKMLSYNALIFFNMKQTQAEKDEVMAQLDEIIRRCQILDCKMIVVVPSMDLKVHATLDEIKADAVAVLKEMVKKVEPHGIKLSIEFCGAPSMSINRFEDAYAIVSEVNHPLVGVTLDQYHFHAMASGWDASAMPIPSRRSALTAAYAPSKYSVPTTTSSPTRRTSKRLRKLPAPTLKNTANPYLMI